MLAGCGAGGSDSPVTTATPGTTPSAAATLAPLPAREVPARAFAVGSRQLALSRGTDRPLPTTLWYPVVSAGSAKPAAGRFPLVILSHGLGGTPGSYAPVGTRWAAAGFVVAAPAYPYTKRDAPKFEFADVVNQPADASKVITDILALDGSPDDPLAGHLDTAAIAATGHSAGGYTTTGLLAGQRDPRVRAAIVVAGGSLSGGYTGAPTPTLFVHGDADETVSYSIGRTAYDAMPWPKAFLTLPRGDHLTYLAPGRAGFDPLMATTTDFLRWTLYGDGTAKGRLPGDAGKAARWESTL